jgi:transcriptional regulator with XRE-family HTH domain
MAHLPPDMTIGDRLRRLRGERGLTQEALAERSGLSLDLIKKLEQGRRQTARLTTFRALTDALDVPLSRLMDKQPRLNGGGERLVLGLRDALLSPGNLPGFDPADDTGEATPPEVLWQHVRRSWRDYWRGDFVELARILPGLIAEARNAHRALGPAAAGPLAQTYQLAADLLVHLGREDLAALGAERGIAAAAAGDDELQWATLHGAYAWALLTQARYEEAERVSIRTAERIEPRFSNATEEHLTVWGGLVLWAAAAAVEAAKADPALDYIALSRVGAARMEHDRHDYQVNFGPTQVAMQATYAYATLGLPNRALRAAQQVRREDLYTISYGRHLLDVAQAHVDRRADDTAIGVLHEAKDLAPVWFRHQPVARTLVGQVRERKARPSAALRDLIVSLDPAA